MNKESMVNRCDILLDKLREGEVGGDHFELLSLIIKILKIAPAVDLETFNP